MSSFVCLLFKRFIWHITDPFMISVPHSFKLTQARHSSVMISISSRSPSIQFSVHSIFQQYSQFPPSHVSGSGCGPVIPRAIHGKPNGQYIFSLFLCIFHIFFQLPSFPNPLSLRFKLLMTGLIPKGIFLLPARPDCNDNILAMLPENILIYFSLGDNTVGELLHLQAADDLRDKPLYPSESQPMCFFGIRSPRS